MSFLISLFQLCFGSGEEESKPSIIDSVKANDTQSSAISQQHQQQHQQTFKVENEAKFSLDEEEEEKRRKIKKNQKNEQETNAYSPHVKQQSQSQSQNQSQSQSQSQHTSWSQVVQTNLEPIQKTEIKISQVHIDHASHVVVDDDVHPSAEEINDVSLACARLWKLDTNRMNPGIDYIINLQKGKKVYNLADSAPLPLFKHVDQSVLSKPTFLTFCRLLSDFNPDETASELVTEKERKEQYAFIEAVYNTNPVRYLHKYLNQKGICSQSPSEFKTLLQKLWFELYNRGHGHNSSCAFEHVFVGEVKKNNNNNINNNNHNNDYGNNDDNSNENGSFYEVSGFHNWIQMYLEESKGRFDYRGYILPRNYNSKLPDESQQVLTLQFEWNGILKKVSTSFIGVSPEFELALYTLCFFCQKEITHVRLGDYELSIKVYRFGRDRLSSAFPVAEN